MTSIFGEGKTLRLVSGATVLLRAAHRSAAEGAGARSSRARRLDAIHLVPAPATRRRIAYGDHLRRPNAFGRSGPRDLNSLSTLGPLSVLTRWSRPLKRIATTKDLSWIRLFMNYSAELVSRTTCFNYRMRCEVSPSSSCAEVFTPLVAVARRNGVHALTTAPIDGQSLAKRPNAAPEEMTRV